MKTLLCFLLASGLLLAQEPLTTGPEKGSLVIAGGGPIGADITNLFINLAGGKDAFIVVIPTAGGEKSYDTDVRFAEQLREYGCTRVTVLHTYDRAMADSDEFTLPLREATGIWFSGGRQWRLVDAYAKTETEKAFWEVLDKGGVIGGTSAGATIQGSYLARGDTKTNQIMMGDHEEGFGFIKNVAIDQHVLARNRQFDMFEILEKRPELLGIGLDESTAIVVHDYTFEVVGKSNVLIYDGSFWSRDNNDVNNPPEVERPFYFLQAGDRYHLKERRVVSR